MKGKTWRKAAAFVLSLTLVTGGMPVNVGSFLTGSVGIVAHAEPGVPVENEEVSSFAELKAAFEAGGSCKLMADIVLTENLRDRYQSGTDAENNPIYTSTDVELDLNGHSLTCGNYWIVCEKSLKITNSSDTLSNITTNKNIQVQKNAALEISGNTKLNSTSYAINIPASSTNASVTASGDAVISGASMGIGTFGANATIILSDNVQVLSDKYGIYTQNYETTNASNATITVADNVKITSQKYGIIALGSSGTLSVTDNAEITALNLGVQVGDTNALTLSDNAKISATANGSYGISMGNNSTVTVGAGTSVEADTYGVGLGYKSNLNVYGNINVTGSGFAIGGNANGNKYEDGLKDGVPQGTYGAVVNIYEGAEVTSPNCVAIFQSHVGTTNIYGGSVTSGQTAIYAKSGTINIEGGSIVSNGDKQEQFQVANGAAPTGDAIVVQSYPTAYGPAPTINISGGTVSSEGEGTSAVGMYNYGNAAQGFDSNANLSVSGNADVSSVNIEDGGIIEISGGTVGTINASIDSNVGTATKTEITISGGQIDEITQNLNENAEDKLNISGGTITEVNVSNVSKEGETSQVNITGGTVSTLNVDEGTNKDEKIQDNLNVAGATIGTTNYEKLTTQGTDGTGDEAISITATVEGATDLIYENNTAHQLIKENSTLTLKKGDTDVENTDNKYKLQYDVSDTAPTDATEWKDNAADITGTNAGTYKVWYRVVKVEDQTTTVVLNPTAITVTINKAKCELNTAPTANNSTYNNGENITLVNAGTASNGTINYAVTDTSQLTAPVENWSPTPPVSPSAAKYRVWYKVVPADTDNYEGISAKHIDVTIAKANITPEVNITGWQYGSYSAETNAPSVTGNSGEGEVTYLYKVKTAADSTYSASFPTAVGEYTVKATIAATENYNGGTATKDFAITQGTPSITITPTASLAYDGTAKTLATYTQTGDNTYYFAVTDSDVDTAPAIEADWATTISTETYAGTYKIWYKAAATDNYAEVEATAYETNVTISPAAFSWKTSPTLTSSRTYNGSAIQLITRQGVPKYGDAVDVEYAVTTTDQAPAFNDGSWTTYDLIKATSTGTYYIWYQVNAYDANADEIPECAAVAPAKLGTITISPYSPPSPSYYSQTWTITMDSYEYDGTAHTPTINGTAYTYSNTQVRYTYYNTGTNEQLDGAPSAIGNYRVEVYADGGSSYYSRTQEATYSITAPTVDKDGKADVAAFKDNDMVPESEGKIFAGWFTDETCTTAYTSETGKAYAKFIDEKILTVKAQISSGTTASSTSTSIRFITSVDSLKYQNVGFKITFNGKTIDQKMTKVYTAINANGAKVKPTVFSADSHYMEAYTLNNIPKSAFGQTFTVTPYYTTQDGTIVDGATNTFTIANMIK